MTYNRIPTPELDRLMAVSSISQQIGEFIDWLSEHGVNFFGEMYCKGCNGSDLFEYRGYTKCRSCNEKESNIGMRWTNTNQCLADYFGIDLDVVEKERRALLDSLHDDNDSGS